MMKKRILASSMASVMALSSVSVVAFADEKKDYGEAVTKDELQAYVDSFTDFIDTKLFDYGSVQSEKFQAAVDHAKTVLEDQEAVASDYSAAYQMVKAVYNKLTIYAADQLKALIKENQAKYDKNNAFNEEIGDLIYTESSYADFTDAFDEAKNYVDAGDSRLVTDAFIKLEDAVKNLSELESITKAEFRAAKKQYEQIEYKMRDYESWRRGKMTVVPETGTSKNKKNLTKVDMSFGELIGIVYGGLGQTNFTYWDAVEKEKTVKAKAISDDDIAAGHTDSEGKWIGGYDLELTASISEVIYDKFDTLDNIVGATATTDPSIVAAYKAALDAVKVFNGWEQDAYRSGSKGACAKIETQYHNRLVQDYNFAAIQEVIDAIEALTDTDGAYGATVTLKTGDSPKLTASKSIAILKDKTTGLLVEGSISTTTTEAKANPKYVSSQHTAIKISAKTDILQYLPNGNVDGEFTVPTAGLKAAVKAYTDLVTSDGSNGTQQTKEKATILEGFVDADATTKIYYYDNLSSATDAQKESVAKINAAADDVLNMYNAYKSNPVLKAKLASLTALANYKGDVDSVPPRDWSMGIFKATTLAEAVDASSNALIKLQKDKVDENDFSAITGATVTTDLTGYKFVKSDKYDAATAGEKTVADSIMTAANDAINDMVKNLEAEAKAQDNLDAINAAYAVYDLYLNTDFTEDDEAENAFNVITDNENDATRWDDGKTLTKASGAPAEWTLIWRKLAYSLGDAYPVSKTNKYTLAQLKALTDTAYDEANKVADSSLFHTVHMSVVLAREDAIEFYKDAKATTGYKPDDELTKIYEALEDELDVLKKWSADFKYSYDEIRDTIGTTAMAIDKGEIKSDAVVKALEQCAYDLSVLEASDIVEGDEINLAFDSERIFQYANRLKTSNSKASKIKPNDFEKALKKSYEDLVKAVEEAKAGTSTGVKNDFNGDGAFTAADLTAILEAYTASLTDKKYDANGDGSFNAADLTAALEAFTAQA